MNCHFSLLQISPRKGLLIGIGLAVFLGDLLVLLRLSRWGTADTL